MLEGRLFTQWQFTFSRGKKDYHLLSSNVESRPPSHSSAGMWKQWGKLNSQTAHTVSCVQVRDYHNQSKHSLQHVGCSGSDRRRWVSDQCRTIAFLQVFKHSKGTNGWGKRPAALAKSSSNICENLWEFSFCRLARYGCKSTLGHQHTGPSAHFPSMPHMEPSYLTTPGWFLNTASSALPVLAAGTVCPQDLSSGLPTIVSPWSNLHTLLHGLTHGALPQLM